MSASTGLGAVLALAFAVTLVPGVVLAGGLRFVGVPLGPSLLIGLLGVFAGMGCYPLLLRRLGGTGGR